MTNKSAPAILLALAMILSAFVRAAPAGPVKALFIYWRGETDCARGLKAGLADRKIKVDITRFNAARNFGKLTAFLAGLDESKYRFIYTFGTTVSLATAKRVKNTPIVFGIVFAPVKAGLIKSWKSSGNNLVGVSHAVPMADQVRLMGMLGKIRRIGFIHNPGEKNSVIALTELGKKLEARGVGLVVAKAAKDREIPAAVKRLIDSKVDLAYLPSVSLVIANAGRIIPILTKHKIRTFGATEALVNAGAMIGVGAGYGQVGQMLAGKVALILGGKKPPDIPSQRVPLGPHTIRVNGATFKKLGLAVPVKVLKAAGAIR